MTYTIKVNNKKVEHVEHLHWQDDLERITTNFDFTTDEKFECGDFVELRNVESTGVVFVGIITNTYQNDSRIYTYYGYDIGFYLNKNTIIEQYRNAQILDVFKDLGSKYGIKIGQLNCPGNVYVDKTFKNETLRDAFEYLLKLIKSKTGQTELYLSCHDGSMNLLSYEENKELSGELCALFEANSTDTIHNSSIRSSMVDLKNKVIVYDDDKTVFKEDINNINRYGLLQHIETVDNNENNNYAAIAKNKLDELNRITTSMSITMLGDYRMHRGVLFPVTNEHPELKGTYLIEDSEHDIYRNKETVKVNIRKYDKV